jgi:hypothetical protein
MGASGTATLDFGAFPGKTDTSVAVTGQAGILSGSVIGAWLTPVATADHSADEHIIDGPFVVAGSIVGGTGFTIYGITPNYPNPVDGLPRYSTNNTPMPYGLWSVFWCWS